MGNQASTELALLEASPPGVADRQLVGAASVKTSGTFEWDTPTSGDTLQLARVPVDSKLISLKIGWDDMGTTLTIDIGFYKVGSPGAVIDQDGLCTALVGGTILPAAADLVLFGLTELRYETQGIDTTGEMMWELANLSDRPSYEQMDIVITATADSSAVTSTVSWIIEYTV